MADKYGLYLSREGTTIRFPVNPESYKISRDNDNADYNVLGVGPIMVPRTPKLTAVAWSGLLPATADFGAALTSGGFQPPKFYIDFLQSAMDERAVPASWPTATPKRTSPSSIPTWRCWSPPSTRKNGARRRGTFITSWA